MYVVKLSLNDTLTQKELANSIKHVPKVDFRNHFEVRGELKKIYA